jgi:hypothetical protein
MQGGCEAQCTSPDGALFCDGQYVDHGGNLDACVAALEAAVSASVDLSARGSASSDCTGNMCSAEAEGEASASCALSPDRKSGGLGGLGLLLAALGFAAVRRR